MERFRNRKDAGQKLAQLLAPYQSQDSVIYALPRGGAVLGAEVAKVLKAAMDLVISRKIGHPQNPEYAIGAVSERGKPLYNESEVGNLDEQWLLAAIAKARAEAGRRRKKYLDGRRAISAKGITAIIVDDGIATGLTTRAAIAELRQRGAAKIVIAVPVIPPDAARALALEADKVLALDIPAMYLGSVGAYYENFEQVSDTQVIRLLKNTS